MTAAQEGRRCAHGFEEALLSGYLDGELTQGLDQRVRLHLGDCAEMRALLEELERLREVTMATRFEAPRDDQWSETPRGLLSHVSRNLGLLLFLVWFLGMTGFGFWEMTKDPEAPLWIKLVTFGGISGLLLAFASALIDRLRAARTDPYKEVEK